MHPHRDVYHARWTWFTNVEYLIVHQYMIYTDIKVSASDVVRAADNSTSKGAHSYIIIITTTGAVLFRLTITKKLKVSLNTDHFKNCN